MGWFSKKQIKDAPEPSEPGLTTGEEVADDFLGRPFSKPLTETEQERITKALDELASRGVDVDDLSAISAAYDAACAARGSGVPGSEPKAACDVYGIAIGEYLARHSTLRWGIVTDAFGTDLGLAAARAETVVVPHNLVSARWMRGERGWIPGVVGHLVRINSGD